MHHLLHHHIVHAIALGAATIALSAAIAQSNNNRGSLKIKSSVITIGKLPNRSAK